MLIKASVAQNLFGLIEVCFLYKCIKNSTGIANLKCEIDFGQYTATVYIKWGLCIISVIILDKYYFCLIFTPHSSFFILYKVLEFWKVLKFLLY